MDNPLIIIVIFTIVLTISVYTYFLPAIKANAVKHPDKTAIFVLNLLLGWLLIPWVIALVWAYKSFIPIEESATIKCPNCAENIKPEAIKCRYCQSALQPSLNHVQFIDDDPSIKIESGDISKMSKKVLKELLIASGSAALLVAAYILFIRYR